jgi:hypothetical protein
MSHERDAELLEILGGQARQYILVDVIVAERWLVLLEAQMPEPT